MKVASSIKRYWRSRSGATAVEFALVAPIAFLLCLSVLEVGRALYTRNELAYAIDLGARRVLLDPEIADQAIHDTILLGLTASIRAGVSIETRIISDSQGSHRFVEASLPFTFIVPLVPQGAFVLSVRRRVPMT